MRDAGHRLNMYIFTTGYPEDVLKSVENRNEYEFENSYPENSDIIHILCLKMCSQRNKIMKKPHVGRLRTQK